MRIAEYAQVDGVRGFPTTVAELSAFDAIILSDVAAEAFTEKQLAVDRASGSASVAAACAWSAASTASASGGWDQTPLAAMLPVEMLARRRRLGAGRDGSASPPELPPTPHPLWNLVADEKQNRQIAGSFPAGRGRQSLGRHAAEPDHRAGDDQPSAACPCRAAAAAPRRSILRPCGTILQDALGSPKPKAAAAVPPPAPASDACRRSSPAATAAGRTLAMAFPITSPYADELVQKWGVRRQPLLRQVLPQPGLLADRELGHRPPPAGGVGRQAVLSPGRDDHGAGRDLRRERRPHAQLPRRRRWSSRTARRREADRRQLAAQMARRACRAHQRRREARTSPGARSFDAAAGRHCGRVRTSRCTRSSCPWPTPCPAARRSQSLRIELTAYEDQTQVDSTSLDIQILHDPFEQQNPFPNHELLERVAAASGGKVIQHARRAGRGAPGRAASTSARRSSSARRCGATGGCGG